MILKSLLSGFLLFAAFAPISRWWCAPLALLFLLTLLSDLNIRRRLMVLTIFFIAFFLPLLAWSNTYVGVIPWLFLTGLQIVLFFPLVLFPLSKNNPWSYLFFPSTWILCEWLTANIPFGGFGWGRVGFSQADAPYAGLARFGGVSLLSFFVAATAVAMLFLIRRNFRFGYASGGVLLVILYSILLAPTPKSFAAISIAGVQGGVPKLGLEFNARAKEVFTLHEELTANYLNASPRNLDLILWPENSVDIDPFRSVDITDRLHNLVNKFGIPVIIGAVTDVGSRIYNESILWEPRQGASSRYAKRHLTPFGEYIPLRNLAEIISPYAKNVADFSAGDQLVIHTVGKAKIAPIICFELIDDAGIREMANQANLLVVQTNNATFGTGPQSAQQLNITRIRAIEHQRNILSISTTGLSAFIGSDGKVTQQTKQKERIVIAAKVGLISGNSFANSFGAPLEALLIAPAWLGLVLFQWSRRKSER